MMVHDLTEKLESKREEIRDWFKLKRQEIPMPIYGSVDIRDFGWKVGVVDANHFPAGFNNVSQEDRPKLAELLKNHLLKQHPNCTWVHLYPESHTRNAAYVENVKTLKSLLEMSGFRCTVGSPVLNEYGFLNGITGPMKIDQVDDSDDSLTVDGKSPCLILLNNDLTEGIVPGLSKHDVTPAPSMGWHRRRKSEHYERLTPYVEEISELLGIDSWHLMPDYFVSEDKCLDKEACRIQLAAEVNEFLDGIRQRYESLGIEREPFAIVKNDAGTYGLGILTVSSGDELLQLSNRKMKKLMYSKGGADVENFIIQEGIPTSIFTENGGPVEPVVYLVDGEAASWFYRINESKKDTENLNSPSARFEPYAEVGGSYGEHAHGWHALVAELSMLAMAAELKALEEE